LAVVVPVAWTLVRDAMIAGIDFSTKAVDVVLLAEDSYAATWHRFELEGQDAFDRARDVRAAVQGWHSLWDDVVACGIEDPRGYGAGSLYRVQGAILSCLPGAMLVQPLIPSSWRKTVGLKGNASKDDVRRFSQASAGMYVAGQYVELERWPDWPQDAHDAYCIALATRTLLHATEQAA
jgi:hypothetical protein